MNKNPMERYLQMYPPPAGDERNEPGPEVQRLSPKKLPIDAELDLHGLTVEEAEQQLELFIQQSKRAGHKKILIIHGKGTHENSEGKLRYAVRSFLEHHQGVGTIGTPSARYGGSGAIFAVLR
jgi:DNA-nicking Smr family endonuclease